MFRAFNLNQLGYAAYLRDGASGTGAILFQIIEEISPGTAYAHSVCDLNIVGSPNTPLTLEFAANGINTGETVNLVGYDTQ